MFTTQACHSADSAKLSRRDFYSKSGQELDTTQEPSVDARNMQRVAKRANKPMD